MKTHVTFRSPLFAPNDEEWAQIESGGMHGQRLAEFFARELTRHGFHALGPIEEDWGWLVPIENVGFRMWIGCGSYEHDDGLLCFIEPHWPKLWKFLCFGEIDTTPRVGALRRAIDEILSEEPSVTNKEWWSYEEFNNPKLTRDDRKDS